MIEMPSILRSVSLVAKRNIPQKPLRCSSRRNLPQTPLLASLPASARQRIPAASFSTMTSLNASTGLAGAAVGGGREYDPEIKDMASYVHNYKIDSDLAVRLRQSRNLPALTQDSDGHG